MEEVWTNHYRVMEEENIIMDDAVERMDEKAGSDYDDDFEIQSEGDDDEDISEETPLQPVTGKDDVFLIMLDRLQPFVDYVKELLDEKYAGAWILLLAITVYHLMVFYVLFMCILFCLCAKSI